YWYLMGTLMTGEWPHLSRRVQRSLPSSLAGRSLFSWFNPGPASGYLFAIANSGAIVLLGCAVLLLYSQPTTGVATRENAILFLVLGWCYLIAYLGIGRLLIGLMRRITYVPLVAAFLLHVILLLAGVGTPAIIHEMSEQFRGSGYSLLLVTNPFWTLGELMEGGLTGYVHMLVIILPAAAVVAFLLNLRSVCAELARHRIAAPERVTEDEEELHPVAELGPSNPWEAEAALESSATSEN
ncbi:MAG: hypothetical protein RID07_13010, partial [Lacipirellulaceae bacterium]